MKTAGAGITTAVKHHGITKNSLIFLFVVLLQLQETKFVNGQSASPSPPNMPYARFSPSMAIIIVVLIAALFFMAFFSIYIRNCNDSTSSTNGMVRRALSIHARRAAERGLDASVLETFPTFTYSEVKDHKIGKGTLECAVCLCEFEDDETLRLIPKCDHVFHPECIDAWLESHVTCPVCRADLATQTTEEQIIISNNNVVEPTINEEIVVDVQEENQEPPRLEEYPDRPVRSWSKGKFRSHSTGHSLVHPTESMERFTLRLPDKVRKEVMNRVSLKRTGSWAISLPREGSSRRGYRGGEGSYRVGRFHRIDPRSERLAKSDRWVFFSRSRSGSSMKSNRTPVKMPSFNCLEPKAVDQTGLFSSQRSDNSPV